MANKPKDDVIKALKICSSLDDNEENEDCEECPYKDFALGESAYKGTNCDDELMKDAIEYLKSQR